MFNDVRALIPPFSLVLIGVLLGIFIHPAWFLLSVFGYADVCGRHADYLELRQRYYDTEFGHCAIPVVVARQYAKSRCGRWLICTLDPAYTRTKYYYYLGYRWWHFLPDGFPFILFQRNFWSALVKGHTNHA